MASTSNSPKWDARYAGQVPHDATYYFKCMLGGILACGGTHTGITPLDVTKCNMQVRRFGCTHRGIFGSNMFVLQVNPTKYRGLVSGLKTLIAEEGATGIWKGWAPTAIGYSLQGMFKYGLYEVFKDFYSNLAGKENTEKYKGLIWCAGSASAEFFADIALCPFEMTKVKVQTSPAGTFPTAFGAALAKCLQEELTLVSLLVLWSHCGLDRFVPMVVVVRSLFVRCFFVVRLLFV